MFIDWFTGGPAEALPGIFHVWGDEFGLYHNDGILTLFAPTNRDLGQGFKPTIYMMNRVFHLTSSEISLQIVSRQWLTQ